MKHQKQQFVMRGDLDALFIDTLEKLKYDHYNIKYFEGIYKLALLASSSNVLYSALTQKLPTDYQSQVPYCNPDDKSIGTTQALESPQKVFLLDLLTQLSQHKQLEPTMPPLAIDMTNKLLYDKYHLIQQQSQQQQLQVQQPQVQQQQQLQVRQQLQPPLITQPIHTQIQAPQQLQVQQQQQPQVQQPRVQQQVQQKAQQQQQSQEQQEEAIAKEIIAMRAQNAKNSNLYPKDASNKHDLLELLPSIQRVYLKIISVTELEAILGQTTSGDVDKLRTLSDTASKDKSISQDKIELINTCINKLSDLAIPKEMNESLILEKRPLLLTKCKNYAHADIQYWDAVYKSIANISTDTLVSSLKSIAQKLNQHANSSKAQDHQNSKRLKMLTKCVDGINQILANKTESDYLSKQDVLDIKTMLLKTWTLETYDKRFDTARLADEILQIQKGLEQMSIQESKMTSQNTMYSIKSDHNLKK